VLYFVSLETFKQPRSSPYFHSTTTRWLPHFKFSTIINAHSLTLILILILIQIVNVGIKIKGLLK